MNLKKVPALRSLSPTQLVKAGYTAAIILATVATAQWLYFPVPWYVYTLELVLPTIMLGHTLIILTYYIRWRWLHRQIAIRLAAKEYRKKSFAALTVEKAKGRIRAVKQRFENTCLVMSKTAPQELLPEDNERIRKFLAAGKIEKAWGALKKGIEHKKVRKKAKEANCLSLVLQRFKDKKFDPEAARNIILIAIRIKEMARDYNVEKEVIAEMENGDLDAAERILDKAQEQQILEEIKEDLISKLRYEIVRLPKNFDQEILLDKLADLEQLEFGTTAFKDSAHEIQDQILRFEIKTQTTG